MGNSRYNGENSTAFIYAVNQSGSVGMAVTNYFAFAKRQLVQVNIFYLKG